MVQSPEGEARQGRGKIQELENDGASDLVNLRIPQGGNQSEGQNIYSANFIQPLATQLNHQGVLDLNNQREHANQMSNLSLQVNSTSPLVLGAQGGPPHNKAAAPSKANKKVNASSLSQIKQINDNLQGINLVNPRSAQSIHNHIQEQRAATTYGDVFGQ